MRAKPARSWQCPSCGYRINGGGDPDLHVCDDRSVIRHLTTRLNERWQAHLATPLGKYDLVVAHRTLDRTDPT